MSPVSRYSEFEPMQELGERLSALGREGPVRRSRWLAPIVAILVGGVVAISPVGAAIADAVDDLIGGEPTTESIFLGDLPGEHKPSEVQRRYFDAKRDSQSVIATGTTPLGTGYELILERTYDGVLSGGPLTSCVFLGFDDEVSGSMATETCIGTTVADGFKSARTPIYPTIYRGPAEESNAPTPIVIGVAPAESARIELTYLGGSGKRVAAPLISAPVTSEMLSPASVDDHSSNMPAYATDPYRAFAAFLPPELDQSGPNARQPRVDLHQIEITAFDSEGVELYSMRMDGRFSGDPGIASVG